MIFNNKLDDQIPIHMPKRDQLEEKRKKKQVLDSPG